MLLSLHNIYVCEFIRIPSVLQTAHKIQALTSSLAIYLTTPAYLLHYSIDNLSPIDTGGLEQYKVYLRCKHHFYIFLATHSLARFCKRTLIYLSRMHMGTAIVFTCSCHLCPPTGALYNYTRYSHVNEYVPEREC